MAANRNFALQYSKINTMKKIKKPEIKIGIWLDQETAFIIRAEGDGEPVVEKIKSAVESRVRQAGEGKVFARFGHAFIDDQEKKQRRQRNQRHQFFKEIISHIQDADYVYLIGPGKAKQELNNEIEKDTLVKEKVVAIEPADKITQKQMILLMTNYFNDTSFSIIKRKMRLERKTH
jgi:hypothetical protein